MTLPPCKPETAAALSAAISDRERIVAAIDSAEHRQTVLAEELDSFNASAAAKLESSRARLDAVPHGLPPAVAKAFATGADAQVVAREMGILIQRQVAALEHLHRELADIDHKIYMLRQLEADEISIAARAQASVILEGALDFVRQIEEVERPWQFKNRPCFLVSAQNARAAALLGEDLLERPARRWAALRDFQANGFFLDPPAVPAIDNLSDVPAVAVEN